MFNGHTGSYFVSEVTVHTPQCIHHSAYTTVWGGGVRAGGLVIQYSILTCFVLFVFIVNNLVNVNIYFYYYQMIHTYIISVFFSTGIGFS